MVVTSRQPRSDEPSLANPPLRKVHQEILAASHNFADVKVHCGCRQDAVDYGVSEESADCSMRTPQRRMIADRVAGWINDHAF